MTSRKGGSKSSRQELPPSSNPADVWEQVVGIVGDAHLGRQGEPKSQEFRGLIVAAVLHGRQVSGPVRQTLGLLGDRWSTLLLQLLHFGPFRFSALQRLVSTVVGVSISRRMLSGKLRALEYDGFVSRAVWPTTPPQVEYALTPMGEELWRQAADLVSWLAMNENNIEAARQQYLTGVEK